MGARLRSWLRHIQHHWIAAIIIVLIIAVIVLIFVESLINGSGFNGFYTTATTRTISSSPPTITKTETYQPGKTLWDWLQLLIIPAVLAVGGFAINFTISRGEQEATKQRAITEREIAEDNQREAALQAYIDKMSELLLDEDSREASNVRTIERVRTLRVLARLDKDRKRSVLQFLYESRLIHKKSQPPLLELDDADFNNANFSRIILQHAGLANAKFVEADFRFSDLRFSTMNHADLYKADLSEAECGSAELVGAWLQSACLVRTRLHRAFLNNANLDFANLHGAILQGANLNGASLLKTDLSNADLSDADLSNVDLTNADLSRVDLSHADLSDALVTYEQLDRARSLQGATMPNGSKHL